jgi:L-ascorbate metabolism protein UlaG (beta-lactamase superfamily)
VTAVDAQVETKARGRPLTLTAARAAAAAELLGARLMIPAHADGWAHFSEGVDEFVKAFDEAGISSVLQVAPTASGSTVKRPAGSQASLDAELRMHPLG